MPDVVTIQNQQNGAALDELNQRRAASRKTAIILGVIAAGIFLTFFMRAVLMAQGQG
jgi:hypothetical protein